MRGTRAVPHHNTVFRQLVSRLPWGELDRLVEQHQADKGVRTLSTRQLLLALLFAQISEAKSLRDIELLLESQAARRYHAGLPQVRRSTLADAAQRRPVAVFTGLLGVLISRAGRKLRSQARECVRLIDSTTVKLTSLSAEWSRFSANVCGAKAHVVYDPDADCPLYVAVTPSRTNDITAAKQMPIEPDATYVFDLGYYDYGWWAKLDAAGCRIVTRLKSNTPLAVIETLKRPKGHPEILSDRIGFLPERLTHSRRNPMRGAVREVRVQTDTGTVLRIVTNDLDLPAAEVAALYKRRWAIELFFRWIKQMLKITHFYGTSEPAVRMQIAVALIAFLLLKLAHDAQHVVASLTQFARLVRANVMHRKPLDRLLRRTAAPEPVPIQSRAQQALLWA
jgi:IS4 transposase